MTVELSVTIEAQIKCLIVLNFLYSFYFSILKCFLAPNFQMELNVSWNFLQLYIQFLTDNVTKMPSSLYD